jgi:hypothetical protein
MIKWMGIIADYAISDKSVILGTIDYDEETEKYTINYTWYDNEQAREGWVA